MITGTHHICILLSTEKALSFYKLLGFEEAFRKERANDKVILLDGYGIQLECFIDDRHPARVTDVTEPLGPRHIALKSDDIEADVKRITKLMNTELECDPQFDAIGSDWTGEKYVFIKDPDGNIVELHE